MYVSTRTRLSQEVSFCISLPVTNLIKHLAPPSRYIICVKLQPNSNAISITSVTGAFGVVCARAQREINHGLKVPDGNNRQMTLSATLSSPPLVTRRRRSKAIHFLAHRRRTECGHLFLVSLREQLQTLIIYVHKTSRSLGATLTSTTRPGSSLCAERLRRARIIFFRLYCII
jgi:hypothetical protein